METNFAGPLITSGTQEYLPTSVGGSNLPVPEYNPDAAPSIAFMGNAVLDPRFAYIKDRVQGKLGAVATIKSSDYLVSTDQIPAAFAANNIAAAQNAANGVPMTLAAASLGVTLNVPIVPLGPGFTVFNAVAPVTAPIVLDFGFAFGNCTANSAVVQVADSTQFVPGMPLVIGGVGNAAGTVPLLTYVASIQDATHIVVASTAVPAAANATAPIGTGNNWSTQGAAPAAHLPIVALGIGAFWHPPQMISRGVSITGAAGGLGGTFLVSGWDVFWQPMTQLITVGAGAVVGYSLKTFKAIASVVPQFADAHNYTVGTTDVFGFAFRTTLFEYLDISWFATSTIGFISVSTGWIAGDTTTPPTNLTGDVRGVIQASDIGGGTAVATGGAGTRSNGSVVGLAMSGRRLFLGQNVRMQDVFLAASVTPPNVVPFFGQPQA